MREGERGEETLRISIEILKKFIADPYACEPTAAITVDWIKNADISLVQEALYNLVQCGLLSIFGDGLEPVYFCRNVALLEAVVELLENGGTAS